MRRKLLMAVLSSAICTMMFSSTVFAATNELTGLPVDDSIAAQRPVAIMVDNEKKALKHYGTGEADVVYEMMNSTANGRVTRLMCLYKDWQNLNQTGSIRSVRTTNIMVADEYNAVLIHDGGPFYINSYLAQPYAAHLSGGFSRIKNGKPTEFTEYCFGSELVNRFAKAGLPTTYTQGLERGTHFVFADGEVDLGAGAVANIVNLAPVFPHNNSMLIFNGETRTYDYSEYGSVHQDAEDGQVLSFKNVILQNVPFTQLDKNGYLTYHVVGSGSGYYVTNGKFVPITWKKGSETGFTHYYDASGAEIKLNRGKTYIGIVPSDTWGTLGIG
ncbi:DUF3048 domain-containing protein [Butyrivibrio sp. CB08]|uniref:DUF3048 domain-containing protein n=1 Tax=Butyrivibrio sp. CB08 TaxID=2364879 RepID=UPI000EA88482|nr:DUF3048 domain-containing protein [Butyrivibrio sp. CB08]RKM62315.1 DUF3048 domain-containing protein [Butyrivibrio sp. CB08]